MDRVSAKTEDYFGQDYLDAPFRFSRTDNLLVVAEDTAIAGAGMLALAPAEVAEYHLGADKQGSGQQRAIVGLLHTAATYYQSMHFERFYLGGGRSTAPDDSLLFFKKGFSSLTDAYQIGSRVFESEDYARLERRFPTQAATRGGLVYKRQASSLNKKP